MFEDFIVRLSEVFGLPILQFSFFGNSVLRLIVAAGVFVLALVAFGILQKVILAKLRRAAEKTDTDVDDTLVRVVESIRPKFYIFLALYFGIRTLVLPPFGIKLLDIVLLIWIVYQTINTVQIVIDFVVHKAMSSEDEEDARAAANLVGKIAKFILWSLGLLMILSNLGINVNSLIAGLGVGGIAIAFALQSILGDLFSSLAIYFDKPFRVGDFIAVGQDMGTVERIGIKTTRLTSLGGEELVISNQELTNARLQNFKNMEERRVEFKFGVTYEISNKLLKEIPQMVKDIIEKVEHARVDRVHFMEFGDSALGFSVVYYVDSREYEVYADVQQEINFGIRDKFEKRGVERAYPTRTLHIVGGDKS